MDRVVSQLLAEIDGVQVVLFVGVGAAHPAVTLSPMCAWHRALDAWLPLPALSLRRAALAPTTSSSLAPPTGLTCWTRRFCARDVWTNCFTWALPAMQSLGSR